MPRPTGPIPTRDTPEPLPIPFPGSRTAWRTSNPFPSALSGVNSACSCAISVGDQMCAGTIVGSAHAPQCDEETITKVQHSGITHLQEKVEILFLRITKFNDSHNDLKFFSV